jgi:hypothetical protein
MTDEYYQVSGYDDAGECVWNSQQPTLQAALEECNRLCVSEGLNVTITVHTPDLEAA